MNSARPSATPPHPDLPPQIVPDSEHKGLVASLPQPWRDFAQLARLDRLINQLLEVGRLDAIGHQSEAETIRVAELLRHCAENACLHHKVQLDEVFRFDVAPVSLTSRRLLR